MYSLLKQKSDTICEKANLGHIFLSFSCSKYDSNQQFCKQGHNIFANHAVKCDPDCHFRILGHNFPAYQSLKYDPDQLFLIQSQFPPLQYKIHRWDWTQCTQSHLFLTFHCINTAEQVLILYYAKDSHKACEVF